MTRIDDLEVGREIEPFVPFWGLRGGHAQTLATLRPQRLPKLSPVQHIVRLADNDEIVLHEDCPRPLDDKKLSPCALLIHGLCGCHGAPYMIRIAHRLVHRGFRAFRMDMRGCGAATNRCEQITHAGRSEDCARALAWIAASYSGPIAAIGFSLGGNQLLRMAGRELHWEEFDHLSGRIRACVAVSPPIDLKACSENMLRGTNRIYSRYFLSTLLKRLPNHLRGRSEIAATLEQHRPQTLWEFDDRLTAPLAGYANANAYYQDCSAMHDLERIKTQTLIIAAENDPIVPANCFDQRLAQNSEIGFSIQPSGGHLGFVDRRGRCWLDQAIERWVEHVIFQ